MIFSHASTFHIQIYSEDTYWHIAFFKQLRFFLYTGIISASFRPLGNFKAEMQVLISFRT